MNVEKNEIRDMILEVARTTAKKELPPEQSIDFTETSALFGGSSPFDSLALVSLVVECERLIQAKYSVRLSLADEQAMSQPVYPFSTVSTLTDYIHLLLSRT